MGVLKDIDSLQKVLDFSWSESVLGPKDRESVVLTQDLAPKPLEGWQTCPGGISVGTAALTGLLPRAQVLKNLKIRSELTLKFITCNYTIYLLLYIYVNSATYP